MGGGETAYQDDRVVIRWLGKHFICALYAIKDTLRLNLRPLEEFEKDL
jgi:hypothetical protein